MNQSLLRTILCLTLVALTSSILAAEKRPNIVYIMLDDAGYADFGCYGQRKFATPSIDALAKEGLRFTQHYAGCTVCAPTRCVLMTGMHTGHSFIRGNKEIRPEGQHPMADEVVTVAELLRDAGYRTGAFGKWGLGNPGSEGDPVNQGFDNFFGYNCQREAHSYYPTHLWDNTKKVPLDGKTYAHDVIMEEALEFIRDSKNDNKPFFCFLPATIPHAAMHVPESYVAPFRKKFPQFEDKIGKYKGPEVRNPIAAFAGMMTKMDEDVGRVMDLLKELDLDDNTVVMFTSDNGPHREGGHDPVFFDSNGPLKGFKRDLYEGGIRAPFIVRWPGKTTAGSESDLLSAHWDVLPTLCEIAQVAAPKDVDGISMLPTLLGESDSQEQHDFLYWEFFERGGKRAVRFGPWKAVQLNLHKKQRGSIEIYNLDDDLGEESDVADKHPELVAKAKEMFRESHSPSAIWKFAGE
jgi:arylsulfatase A-like enzyme